jgi:hypothetical protein
MFLRRVATYGTQYAKTRVITGHSTTRALSRYGMDIVGVNPKSCSTVRAVLRPGRPDTEPPGCEVEPVR